MIESGRIDEPCRRSSAPWLSGMGAAERSWLARVYLLADKPVDAQAQIGVLRSLDAGAAARLPPRSSDRSEGHTRTTP